MSLLRIVAVAGLAVCVGAASIGDVAAPRRPRGGCPPGFPQLSQAMDGRISGCVRLGPLAGGPHTLVLQQILDPARPAVPRRPPPEPAVAVSLSPDSGRPGTVITVTGRLRRPFGGRRFAYPGFCWAGCAHGLGYGGVAVHWISPRAFRARLTIPAAPWLMNGTARVAPLAPGRYTVAVQCLRAGRACAGVSEGAAVFTLRDAHAPAWCRTPAGCARLRVTPGRAHPGELVRVSGFAPLTSVSGGDQPFLGQTATPRGRARGPQVRFGVSHGLDLATLGHGGFDVIAPPAYTALHDVAPIGTQTDGLTPIAADPAAPSVVAWCQGTSIAVSTDGTTTSVPTAAAAPVLKEMGFTAGGPQSPQCASVAPIAGAAGSLVGLAAAFSVGLPPGVPPSYDAAVVTHDAGRTWAPVPVPPGSTASAFGGFRYRGAALEAVFGTVAPGKTVYPVINAIRARAEITTPDGRGWTAASVGCPPAGPCVSFSPFAPGNCAMNGSEQPLVRSTDGGRRWSELDFPPWVQACGQATLMAVSARSEYLVDSTSSFPVLRTTDGGLTWDDVALPRRGGNGDLTVLPDGSLVMSGGVQYVRPWKLLRRGAHAWCALTTPSAALQRRFQLSAPAVIGGELWWLSAPASSRSGPATPQATHLPLTALRC